MSAKNPLACKFKCKIICERYHAVIAVSQLLEFIVAMIYILVLNISVTVILSETQAL